MILATIFEGNHGKQVSQHSETLDAARCHCSMRTAGHQAVGEREEASMLSRCKVRAAEEAREHGGKRWVCPLAAWIIACLPFKLGVSGKTRTMLVTVGRTILRAVVD
jgi:hypothetical protein